MKKNIILSLLASALLFIACEEKEWVARDIENVPVYTLSGFSGDQPLQQDVYQTKPVMIEFTTETQLLYFTTSGFVDNSTDSTYDFEYVVAMNEAVDNNNDTIVQTLFKRECAVVANIDSVSSGYVEYIDHYRFDTITSVDATVLGSKVVIDTVFPPTAIVVEEGEKYYVVE